MFHPRVVMIAGAGFSANAGLPLASQFTTELLNIRGLKLDGPSVRQVAFIRDFVDTTFGEGEARTALQWPELEDIFTLIDLAANSGHHLGPEYAASRLRTVRRAILVRMIRMLEQRYQAGQRAQGPAWEGLETFFREFNLTQASVLSMNWDMVFEQGIERAQSATAIDYGCGARRAAFRRSALVERRSRATKIAHVLKPHGSVNWLYCDACRELFWVSPEEVSKVARTLFRSHDWAALGDEDTKSQATLAPACPDCEADALGSRFATFSFRKALEFPMFAASWRTAEQQLKWSRDWVFFGYSMPSADYEFKHLLKRVQLTETVRPRITVITGGDSKAVDTTVERFEKFFGTVSAERTYFREGLNTNAMEHLRGIGLLNTPQKNKRQKATRTAE